MDCIVWLKFLNSSDYLVINRPMTDLSSCESSVDIEFYSDASGKIGFGAMLHSHWIRGDWPSDFITQRQPSIEFLELFALMAGIFTWQSQQELRDTEVLLHCDNVAVIHMINNNLSSSCEHCMVLLRLLTLNGLQYNRRLAAQYIDTKSNFLSDALSRNQTTHFRNLGPHMNTEPDPIPTEIWPIEKLWNLVD